uniref:NET domain-containing protein n=1 Tax=viral metagenome TaxID=1070528 RepID=A0A6C0D3H2_9ZZZZ
MTTINLETPDVLEHIKNRIENLDKYHQIEILKILNKNACKLNENKSGVYVNLSFLSSQTVNELKKYIDYTNDQEESLVTMEYQKEEFKNAFFIEKEDKDNLTVSYSSVNNVAK